VSSDVVGVVVEVGFSHPQRRQSLSRRISDARPTSTPGRHDFVTPLILVT
jgi:hypothetical protein